MNMPRCDGMELLRNVRKHHESIVPIVVTGFGKIDSAVEAVRLGAVDYLTKPVVDDELRLAVNKAVNQHTLVHENKSLKTQLSERFGMGNLVGQDYRMQKVYDLVETVGEIQDDRAGHGRVGHRQEHGRPGDPHDEPARPAGRSSPSPAARSPRRCWSPSSSAT